MKDFSIIMEVHYITKDGMRDDFLREVAPFAQLSREEDGNYSYEYFLNPNDRNDILLLEKWRNDDILEKHFNMEHFKEISKIKEKYIEETIFNKHYIEDK